MRLKRETQGAFGVLNANAKSQTRKSMKINVICTVRPSASSYQEEDRIAIGTTLSTDLVTPVFQPLCGGTGRRWEVIEYGITTDNASL